MSLASASKLPHSTLRNSVPLTSVLTQLNLLLCGCQSKTSPKVSTPSKAPPTVSPSPALTLQNARPSLSQPPSPDRLQRTRNGTSASMSATKMALLAMSKRCRLSPTSPLSPASTAKVPWLTCTSPALQMRTATWPQLWATMAPATTAVALCLSSTTKTPATTTLARTAPPATTLSAPSNAPVKKGSAAGRAPPRPYNRMDIGATMPVCSSNR
mmetsp:Transcript_11723/g.22302  ORF Transcript_11723/g.22302 Transcript_11723/m.22302 type:complete len:213 (+) Transcript_11723:1363-2001(+)